MSFSIPPFPPEVVALTQGGMSILVGTRGADLMAEGCRGVGLRVWPDLCGVTVFVPRGNGRRTLANLADNGLVAITLARVATHQSLQLKGTVRQIRDATDGERPLLDTWRDAFAEELSIAGVPRAMTRRMINWPAAAVEVAVAEVYAQTPGPGAGNRMTA